MRLAYVCTDREVQVPGGGAEARLVAANLLALERAGHDLTFFATGEGGVVAGAWRVVRQRGGNGPKELRDHYAGRPLAGTAREIWSLSVNHRLSRTLDEEHRRAPLQGVIERLSPWSYAAAAFCHQRRVPYVVEAPARSLWERWRTWDGELEAAAQGVHAFAVSRAALIVVQTPDLVPLYRSLSSAPVLVVGGGHQNGHSPRPDWADGFTLVAAGPAGPFHDVKTLDAAGRRLPQGLSFKRLPGIEGLQWARAGVVPASVGPEVDLSPYLAASLPLVVPMGSPAARLPVSGPRSVYSVGDPSSVAAAMVAIRDQLQFLPKRRAQSRAARLAELVTTALEAEPVSAAAARA